MSQFTSDLVERAIRTFVQAALAAGALSVSGVTDLDSAKAALIAAVAAGLSAVMSLVAHGFGDPATASVLPTPSPAVDEDGAGPADPVG